MKNQCYKSLRNPALGKDSLVSLALALTLALLSCSQLGAAQTVSQTPAAGRDGTTRANNVKWDAVEALALQPDGKIIVAGITGNHVATHLTGRGTSRRLRGDFALARYSVDGSLDASFGEGGKAVADFAGNDDHVRAIALQPDGKILLVGETAWDNCDSDFALARFNSDGTPDTTFGQGGKVVTDFFGGRDRAIVVALQGDGRIVVTGDAVNDHVNLALARYNRDGSLDKTFGKNGQVATPSDSYAFTSSISLRPNGKISVAIGSTNCYPDGRSANSIIWDTSFTLTRYHADGRLDAAFANNGTTVTVWREPAEVASAMTIQPDGKSILAGATNIEGRRGYFALHRFNEDGRFDDSFGHEGKVATLFDYSTEPQAIGTFPDGSFIVVGSVGGASTSGSKAVSLARYTKNGKLDLSFGKEGKVITPCGGTGECEASAIALQPDGKIIVGGYSETGDLEDFLPLRYDGDRADFLLLRYDKDGTLDPAFGSGGRVFADFNGITDKASAFALKRSRNSTVAQKPDCARRSGLSITTVSAGPKREQTFKDGIPTGMPTGVPGPPSTGPGSGSGIGVGKGGGIGPGSGMGVGPGGGASMGSGTTGSSGPATAVDQRPVLLNNPSPRYTEEARKNKVQGTVTLRLLIGADGTVKQVRITRGLPDGLDEMAIAAAYQMRFRPAMKGGQPVSFWQTFQIEFNLR
jgi:TonB family protein